MIENSDGYCKGNYEEDENECLLNSKNDFQTLTLVLKDNHYIFNKIEVN